MPASKYKPEYCQMLIDSADYGTSFQGFAGKIGVERKTLYNWVEQHPEFAEAKKLFEARARFYFDKMAHMAMTGQIKPNPVFWIFSMKNRFGWRDKAEVKNEDKGEIKVNIYDYGKKPDPND